MPYAIPRHLSGAPNPPTTGPRGSWLAYVIAQHYRHYPMLITTTCLSVMFESHTHMPVNCQSCAVLCMLVHPQPFRLGPHSDPSWIVKRKAVLLLFSLFTRNHPVFPTLEYPLKVYSNQTNNGNEIKTRVIVCFFCLPTSTVTESS